MKKILLRLAVLFCTLHSALSISKAQYVTIPDSSFAAWLHANGWDSCMVGNQLDTICSRSFDKAAFGGLNLSNLNISDISGIQYIDWCSNPPCYPSSVRTLNLSHNNFTQFPQTLVTHGDNISIDLSYNHIDTVRFDASFSYYDRNLNLSHNQMKAFIYDTSYPVLHFNQLFLNDNELDTLPNIYGASSSGYWLEIRRNRFRNIPRGNISYLDCGVNQITTLPTGSGHHNLGTLIIDSNLLTSLDLFGYGIFWNQMSKIDCSHNAITSITNLNFQSMGAYGRGEFICNNNLLTTLPPLPFDTWVLRCHNNLLTSIPQVPDSLNTFYCNDNPNLNCLPQLGHIANFDFHNTGITCLPNYPLGNISSNPALGSLPLCNVLNQNGCQIYWNVAGDVYLDDNANCVNDSIESGLSNMKVQLWRDGNLIEEVLTVSSGVYSFVTDSFGNYEIRIDTNGLPLLVSCPADNVLYDTLTVLDSLHFDKDFALRCKPGFDLAAWSISAFRSRPALIAPANIHVGSSSIFYGINCTAGISGSVTVSITGPAHYVSPAPGAFTPDNVTGNTLTYDITDFGTVDFDSSFNIMVQTDSTALFSDTICFTVTVSPITGDDLPINNIQTICFPVRASYDPNDKQVYPLNDVDVNGEKWLTYTINFQNTGTDTAIHIYITDTLDTDLDVSTFQLLAYSHQPMVQIKENAVRFNFPNIYLVDSNANEPLSHGYVQYKIKIKDGKPVGTVINNTAYIYFDFNAPVVTNTTVNTIAIISAIPPDPAISGKLLRLYPNPASGSVTLEMDKIFTGGSVTVSDITGRAVKTVPLITNHQSLIADFANGVYFVTVTATDGRSLTKKLVIQK